VGSVSPRHAPPGAGELEVGQVIEATVEKPVYRGRGLVRVEGRVVFVPRGHAGDRVRARVREVHPGWAEADLEEVVTAGPGRRPSPCPYVPRCGGCVFQDLGYEAQLAARELVLRESLGRAGLKWEGPISVHSSPEQGWRLRAAFHFSSTRNRLMLGLRQEGTRRLVDIEECLQLSTGLNRALGGLRERLGAPSHMQRRLSGVDLLESPDESERVALVSTTLGSRDVAALADVLDGVEDLSGLGVDAGRRPQWLGGSPHVQIPVLGLSLQVHVQSFFQANRFLYEPLVQRVLDLLPGSGPALDLYAGVGLFAVPLAARDGGEVVAIERARTAVLDARANARRHGLDGLRVVSRDVGTALAELPRVAGERMVLDPPRTGLERDVVDLVGERQPESIVYVSCDPPTLGRDLVRFETHGLRPDTVEIFDLFPDTFHLETVVRLRRA